MKIKWIHILLLISCHVRMGMAQTHHPEWDSLYQTCTVWYDKGEYETSIELAEKTIPQIQGNRLVDSLYLSRFHWAKANALRELYRNEEASEYYESAIGFSPKHALGSRDLGCILFDRAFVEYEQEAYIQSYATVQKAEVILSTIPNTNYDYLLSIYGDLVGTSSEFGFYDDARQYLKKGEALYQKVKQIPAIRNSEDWVDKDAIYHYKAIYLYSYTKDESALLNRMDAFEKLKTKRQLNAYEQRLFAICLNLVGDHFINTYKQHPPQVRKGLQYLKKAMNALDKETYPDNYAQFFFNKLKAYAWLGQTRRANDMLDELFAMVESDDYRIPFFHAMRAQIHQQSKDYESFRTALFQMIQSAHRGKEILKKDYSNFQSGSYMNEIILIIDMADLLQTAFTNKNGVQEDALNLYLLALRQFRTVYQGKGLNRELRSVYQRAIRGIIETQKGSGHIRMPQRDILNQLEHIESRLVWDEFIANRVQNQKLLIPDSLIRKEAAIRSNITQLLRSGADELALFEMEEQLRKHLDHIEEAYPLHAMFTHEGFDVSQLQQKISPSTIILRYAQLDSSLYLFIIRKDKIEIKALDTAFIRSWVDNWNPRSFHTIETNQRQVFTKQLIPLDISDYQQLIIIPTESIHHIPFGILWNQEGILLEQHAIQYASHLNFIYPPSTLRSTRTRKLFFAPEYHSEAIKSIGYRNGQRNIEGAKKESEWLARHYSGELFSGLQANKKQFLSTAPEAQILHLSMHGFFNKNIPGLSYLMFGDDESEKLYLEELYGMDMNADMAVLSACNTGLGTENEFEGIISLNRAFNYAGVSSTIASLWEVPDESTRKIMQSFYQYLDQGITKSEALRKAKLEYLDNTDDPNFREPYHWAGFVVYGENRPVELISNTKKKDWWIFPLVFIPILMGFLFLLRKNRN